MPRLAALILLPAALVLPGCLERTIRITSEPPGAVVWLNDTELGRTPVETDFTFYGVYDVRLHLEGYEPLTTSREAKAPIYEYPGIDLIAEAVPARIPTLVEWDFKLVPLAESTEPKPRAEADLLARAREMRGTIDEGTPQPLPTGEGVTPPR
jgi:hypothetical protein